jgi:RimJ/RimL family protein N-acetyltransferase
MESLLEIKNKITDLGYDLRLFSQVDEEQLYIIFRQVIDAGNQFPYQSNSKEEFHQHFFGPKSQVYVCNTSTGEIIGGFYLRTNPGESNSVANAGYMILEAERGKGVGSLLIKASLHLAKEQGHTAMQFNLVLSKNSGAIKLYKKLGFEIVDTIPAGVRNRDGSFQDGYMMYRDLNDII